MFQTDDIFQVGGEMASKHKRSPGNLKTTSAWMTNNLNFIRWALFLFFSFFITYTKEVMFLLPFVLFVFN